MFIALVGYFLYPTAPPRLMPEWGFTDSVQHFTGIKQNDNSVNALINLYAAVPSMHVGFALMIGIPLSKLVKPRPLKIALGALPAADHLGRRRHGQPLRRRRLPRGAHRRHLRPHRSAAVRARPPRRLGLPPRAVGRRRLRLT